MNDIEKIITELNLDLKKNDVFCVWHLDSEFKILDISEGVEKILGYPVDDIKKTEFTEYMLPLERKYFIKELKDYSKFEHNECNIITIFQKKDESHIVLETRWKTIFTDHQKVSGYVGITFYI